MSLVDQVALLEEHKKYLAAGGNFATGATCQDLAEFKEAPAEELTEQENKIPRLIWVAGLRVSPTSDVESDSRLKYIFPDPLSVPSKSPFDVLDEMLPDKEKVRKLINFIRNKSTIQFAPALAARIHFLYEVVEEDPDEVSISPESLSNFICFLQNTPNLKYPDVVLTPSNEIRAQWRTAPNRHFAVVFLPNGTTRYVIFTPNLRDPDRIDRLSGITSVDTLMDRAEPHRVLDWASL